jgi:hypothetical protein
MAAFRVLSVFLLLAGVCSGGTARTTLRTKQHKASDVRSCEVMIVGIDGKSLSSPQQKLTLSPGRHALSIRVWFLVKEQLQTVDAPLADVFKPHRYLIDGGFVPSGKLELVLEDEDERPAGVKPINMH